FERYCFQLVMHPKLKAALNCESLLKEEAVEMELWSRELLAPVQDLLYFEFVPGVSFWDLLRVQRLFNLMRWYGRDHLLKLLQSRRDLVIQSMVPCFSEAELLHIVAFAVG